MNQITHIHVRLREAYAARFQPEGLRALAELYWGALLMIALIVVLGAITLGVMTVRGVLEAVAGAADTTPLPAPAFDRSTLDAVVQGFAHRQSEFDSLRQQLPAALADPSK